MRFLLRVPVLRFKPVLTAAKFILVPSVSRAFLSLCSVLYRSLTSSKEGYGKDLLTLVNYLMILVSCEPQLTLVTARLL